MKAWRLVQQRHAANAFNGAGARLYGGRWNHRGTSLVYAAESLALAALEMLVHLQRSVLMQRYCCIALEFDPALCQTLESPPANWRLTTGLQATRDLGSAWFRQQESAVLRVPSAIVPQENNYLFNPHHPDFVRMKIGQPEIFTFDPRLA